MVIKSHLFKIVMILDFSKTEGTMTIFERRAEIIGKNGIHFAYKYLSLPHLRQLILVFCRHIIAIHFEQSCFYNKVMPYP